MQRFKNLIFDLGGVLLTEDDNWLFSEETKKLLGTNDERLSRGWNYAWPDARDGRISEVKFFEIFLENSVSNIDSKHITRLKEIYRKMSSRLESFPLLDELKTNYKLFALANIARDWLNYKVKKYGLDKYFDLIISSCGEGVAKPHREIFLSLIKKANINPEESLFIDNMEKNIGPAKEIGFKTILFTNRENLIKEMKKLGIVI